MTAAGPEDALAAFDLPSMLRFADLALAELGDAREEIDALNVYPVPDGDTGTNMFLTFEAARAAMLDALASRPRASPDRATCGRRWLRSRGARCWGPGATPA